MRRRKIFFTLLVISLILSSVYLVFYKSIHEAQKNLSGLTSLFSDKNTKIKIPLKKSEEAREEGGKTEGELKPLPESSQEIALDSDKDKSVPQIYIEELFSGTPPDTSNIEAIVAENGTRFAFDFSVVEELDIGEDVDVGIDGRMSTAKVQKKKNTQLLNNTYMRLDFEGDEDGEFMTVYYGKEGVKGKIYIDGESYIYEHNGVDGFYMSLFTYKKLNNALVID